MRRDSRIHRLDEVESTNKYLLAKAPTLAHGSVVYSMVQTAGRGRNGRIWVIEPEAGVAISVLIDAPPDEFPATWIPLLAGWATAKVCERRGISGTRVKWPNDVLVEGAKLAGILVERTADGRFVVGCGVNVYSSPQLSSASPTTSFREAGVEIADVERELVEPWVETLIGEYEIVSDFSVTECVERWKGLVLIQMDSIGREVVFSKPDGLLHCGRAVGLHDDGGLIVEVIGSPRPFIINSGDIFHLARS